MNQLTIEEKKTHTEQATALLEELCAKHEFSEKDQKALALVFFQAGIMFAMDKMREIQQ